jgi:hypothetical protein
MKKYFAKYVTVDGKIKEGYCLDTRTKEIVYYNGDYGDATPTYLKKVKMFLCSRDIQVGDKVCDNDDTSLFIEIIRVEDDKLFLSSEHFPSLLPEGLFVYKNNVFKTIGEISSGATWVKEGDEFDEDEIQRDVLTKWYAGEDDYTEYCHHHPKGDKKFILPSDEEYITESPIKIKGPCGYLH